VQLFAGSTFQKTQECN